MWWQPGALAPGTKKGVQDTVHTAVALGLVSGVLLAVVGFCAARGLLELMSCPEDVISLSTLYLKIYFIGMPMTMLYNFSSALLRAMGDTKRPLYCLAAAGVINVVLNLVFVIGFSMSVAGVALATIISQTVSALLVTGMLVREEGALRLDLRRLAFHAGTLKQILLIGLPAGLQSTVFSLSNVVIQSSINSFGSMVVAGNSASSNLEGFVYTAMNAFAQAAVTFTSQNIGARKYHNLDRVIRNCLLCVVVTGLVLGGGAALAGHQLLRFYSSDTAVIATGAERLRLICGFYLLCGIMDVLASSLRGLGYSVLPMVVSLVGVCVLRLVWIATIFQLNRTPFYAVHQLPHQLGTDRTGASGLPACGAAASAPEAAADGINPFLHKSSAGQTKKVCPALLLLYHRATSSAIISANPSTMLMTPATSSGSTASGIISCAVTHTIQPAAALMSHGSAAPTHSASTKASTAPRGSTSPEAAPAAKDCPRVRPLWVSGRLTAAPLRDILQADTQAQCQRAAYGICVPVQRQRRSQPHHHAFRQVMQGDRQHHTPAMPGAARQQLPGGILQP